MRLPLSVVATLSLLPFVYSRTSGDLCVGTAHESAGNWYCAEVQKIVYRGISQAGTYNRTTGMNVEQGLCYHEPVSYPPTGPLTPLLGEVSMHLRGPMNISQLAVYSFSPSTTVKKREGGGHGHRHRRAAGWNRVGYYTSAAPAQAYGLAFLANLGTDWVSGTWDSSFGGSLAYVSADGRSPAPGNTPFAGKLDTSEVEIVVLTDRPCNGDECGYTRPKSVAHHGWTGESKAFLIEFQMDHYDNRGNDQGMLSDAPAWWFLNANIPRILQYGSDRMNIPCSCWATGCGEFDAFEVLARGDERAKSTLHRQGNSEGGDSNYFRRPVGRTMKFAVVFYEHNITAAILPDNFSFRESLSASQIREIVAYDHYSSAQSLFAIGS